MKFTVEIDEFWLNEDSNGFDAELKEAIKNDVCHQIKKLMLTLSPSIKKYPVKNMKI